LPRVRLTVVGCSPSWPNPGGSHSGYLVEGESRLLLDCGPGVLARLRTSSDWPEVDAIAITHFHLDHWGDLVPWVWGAMYGPGRGRERPVLHVPPGGRDYLAGLADQFGGQSDMFEQAFAMREYAEGVATRTAGFELVPIRLQHYGLVTHGFRVTDGRTTLAYSADSGPGPELVELARGADLFVCEATLAESEPGLKGHLALDEARAAFDASGAHRLLVTHRPHELAVDPDVELAYEGLQIEL
jgi:ribonuclease BN (tRNA processing enzyme)